jgi:hypothetical protein
MSSKTRTRTTRTTRTTGSTRTLQSVPDQATTAKVRTDTGDKLWEALHANPNSTAAELSSAAKIGKSTAQKILATWEGDGSVTRTAGIAEGGRRAADLWAITDGAPADHTDSADTAQADPTTPIDPDTTDAEATDQAEAEPAHDGATTDSDTAADGVGDEKPARLAPGGLRGMVEDYLRDHLGEEFGPTAIAKALGGKSSGAVSNALDKLVEATTVVKTKESPRRFTLAPAEQAAASTPTN